MQKYVQYILGLFGNGASKVTSKKSEPTLWPYYKKNYNRYNYEKRYFNLKLDGSYVSTV